MNGLSTDSIKLLTEKLSLARELATLKTELNHLRTQANYQQTVLAEKLALQRQVSTLEVELETEKRASKRTGHKEKGGDNEVELQQEVEELRKELSRERWEKEKAQKAGDKGSNEWESRKTVLESKVEQLRTKLRESKEQVKELRTELAQAQAAITKASTTATNSGDSVKPGRKRTANQISTDSMIGTPGGVAVRGKRPATKSGKPDQSSLGEKSMFSITPYLNRTFSVAPETPRHEAELEANDGREVETNGQTPTADPPQPAAEEEDILRSKDASKLAALQPQQKKKTKEKTILTDAKNTVINTKVPQKKVRMVGTLEKVTEEEVDENVEPPSTTATLASMKPSTQNQAMAAGGAEPKKKKRKLLGAAKTIFDEDDGEATKRPAKIILGPARSSARGQPVGNKGGLQSSLSGNTRGFGAFSPLKRDRRGAQASFA
jgi:ribosomal protein L29